MDLILTVPCLIFLLCLYYFYFVSQKIRIYGGNSVQLEFLNGLDTVKKKYYPTPVFSNGLLHSLYAVEKRSVERLVYKREIFKMADGGEIALDYKLGMVGKEKVRPTLAVIIPGYGSTSQTPYIRTLVLACDDAEVDAVVINYRGLAGVALKTHKWFCPTNWEDVSEVMQHLAEKFPEKRMIGVGTSMGGIMFSHYLIQCPEEAARILECVVLVSVVWDQHGANRSIERPIIKQVLNYPLAKLTVRNYLLKQKKFLEVELDVDEMIGKIQTLHDVAVYFVAPNFGYQDIDAYYNDSTLINKTHKFPIPVFALNAADDPMQPRNSIPLGEAEGKGSNLVFLITASGGHLGFLEGIFPTKHRLHFVDRFLKDFLTNFDKQGGLKANNQV